MNVHQSIAYRIFQQTVRPALVLFFMLFTVGSFAMDLPACIRSTAGKSNGETPGTKDLGKAGGELAKDALFHSIDEIGGKLVNAAGEKLNALDDLVMDPIETIMENPIDDKAFERLLAKIGEGGLKVFVPGAGVVIEGTRAGIGGTTFIISEVLDEHQRGLVETRIFGESSSGNFGYATDLMSEYTFFGGDMMRHRGLSAENIAQKVTSEQDLSKLWFSDYKAELLRGPMGLSQNQKAEVDQGLQDGWPTLQQFWRLKRTEIVLDRFQQAITHRAKEMAEKHSGSVEGEKSPVRDLSGLYKIGTGVNPGGARHKSYPGEVRMNQLRDVYEIKWTITESETSYGIGIQVDDILAVGYGGTDYGVAVYRICEGKLSGLWSHKSLEGLVGTEQWEGPATLNGAFTITTGQNPLGKTYEGTVSVKPNGSVYDVYWTLSNGEEHRGVGIKFSDLFIVGWGKGAGVVNYLIEPNLLKGQWGLPGDSTVGTEVLSPSGQH